MPVSPADFEFYSRMTGQPIPNTPAGRMAIAPQVYNMRRGGGDFGRVLRGAAKGALAAGALAGAGALALATQEEVAKTGGEKKAKVTENLTDTGRSTETTTGGQKVTVSATDSEVAAPSIRDKVQDFVQGFKTDSGEELVGTAATPEQIQEFRNRYSGQTQIPVASPEVENESLAAQRASVQAPTEPRVGVRQQPSSGVIQTDLSNVAAKEYSVGKIEPGTEMITDPELNKLAQQYEFYEASQDISPFQAPGTEAFPKSGMELLAEQSRSVDKQEKDLAREILSGLADEGKVRMAGSVFTTDIPGSSAVSSIQLDPQDPQYMGVAYTSNPSKTYRQAVTPTFARAMMSQMDRLSDPEQSSLEQSEMGSMGKLLSGMKKTGAMVKEGQTAPESLTPSAFVTNKGREVGAVMKRVEEAKAAAAKPVTLGEIAGDVVSALNPFKDRKAEAQKRQQAEQLVIKSHGDVKDPVQRQKLIDFYMKQK